MIAHGAGTPLILIPGIQGRWQWMRPAIDALGRRYRVLTFSLSDVHESSVFEGWSRHIDALLETSQCGRAPIVGFSFGGLVAAYYAATRPERTTCLVLVSAPSPRWSIDAQSVRFARRPRLSLPLFAYRAIGRLAPEIRATFSSRSARLVFAASHAARVMRAPPPPRRMAAWVKAWTETDLTPLVQRISAPTLIITGEPELDRVVPVASTLEYLTLITGSRHVTLGRTGHLGFASRPHEFAALVTDFVEARTGTR